MKKFSVLILFFSVFYSEFYAQTYRERTVLYYDQGTAMEGFAAFPSGDGKFPVVMVTHEWTGLNEYVKTRCRMLAGMGYIAFAPDVYGKGIRPAAGAEAGKVSSSFKNNRPLLQQRMISGLQQAKQLEGADTSRIAAIGYCFGGTAVLELARSGVPLKGVVSFHGGLSNPAPENTGKIRGEVLICHGEADPNVPPEEVNGFKNQMDSAGVDYTFISYSGAVHAFTNPSAGNDPSKGAAYNERADKQSWEHMEIFLDEIFKPE